MISSIVLGPPSSVGRRSTGQIVCILDSRPYQRKFYSQLLINVSALSDARFHEEVKAGTVFGARSIKLFERSRPWMRRTRPLWEFNGGKVGCRGAPKLCGRARRTTLEDEKVTKTQNSCEENSGESRRTWFVEGQGRERPSELARARISCGRESFHAATVTRPGGERSRISAAESLSMTLIGAPHFGQSQRSLEPLLPDRSGSACGAEPRR